MEPASASIAFIGVAASLTTLAALVIDSSKTLYRVGIKLKKAPEDITRLLTQLKLFERLLSEAQQRVEDHKAEFAVPDVGTLFTIAAERMLKDVRDFEGTLQKCERLLSGPASTKKALVSRVQHVLKEDRLKGYERLISSHMATLTLLLEILDNRKLQSISLQTKELLVKNDAGFRTIQSQIESFRSSQNVSRSSYQIQLADIEGRLSKLQERLYFDNYTTRKVSNTRERVEATDMLSLCSRRKSYVDLRLFGQVVFDYKAAAKRGSRRPAYCLTYTFIPPAWLSYLILHWDLYIQKMPNRPPRLSFSLSPMRYNPSSELKAAVTRFDTPALHRLFGEGHAHPTDYIVQRRPITLLEAFASRVDRPTNEALEMYRYLVKIGCGNNDPKFAAWHARVLIAFAKHSQSKFRDALDAFMAYGGNVFWRTSDRATILTLIMRHGATFEGLSQVFFRQREPWTVVQLSQTDRWLAAIYEYTDPKFRNAFKSCLSEYRTGLEASQILPSINMVVSEMQHAPARDRVEFLKIVSKWGTADMILPFIRAGVDLDEKLSNEQTPWLRLSYLSKAARCKNLNTFQTLLDAGACPARALIYLSRHPDNLPLCRRMILTLAERAKPQHLEVYNGELLALLLRTDHVRRYSSSAAGALIDRFILRRHFNFNECEKLFNSYVLVSVLLDLPAVLQHFYSTVSTICGNKPICKVSGNQYVSIKSAVAGKYTWLTFAVHLGLAACVKVFLDNGAHCEEPDPCGQTALQMAKDYVSGPHPRATTELQIWPYQPPQRSVSIEDDQKVLATLHHAAVTRAALTTRSEYHDSWGGTSEPLRTDKLPLQACSGPNDRSIWARVLGNDAVIVTSGLHNLEGLARVIRCDGPIRKLWTIAVRLSRLTLTEAVLLRAGYMLSLIALMLCLIVEFFWH